MSRSKKDQSFPCNPAITRAAELVSALSVIFQIEYSQSTSAVKQLARTAGVSPRTAKNWYYGKNLITLNYLSIIAERSPSICKQLWTLVLRQEIEGPKSTGVTGTPLNEVGKNTGRNLQENVSINVIMKIGNSCLNNRQRWFLEALHDEPQLGTRELAIRWDVDVRTAYRDIAKLLKHDLITRVGSRRTGSYRCGWPAAYPCARCLATDGLSKKN